MQAFAKESNVQSLPNTLFAMNYYTETPNPSHAHNFDADLLAECCDISGFLLADANGFKQHPLIVNSSMSVASQNMVAVGSPDRSMYDHHERMKEHMPNGNNLRVKEGKVNKNGVTRVAFKTKSEKEVMDDGYKWRKYGKKSVKNSPNPRNYYKCSSEGCNVKKRVERDRDDPSYVMTTYEGVHNHESLPLVEEAA